MGEAFKPLPFLFPPFLDYVACRSKMPYHYGDFRSLGDANPGGLRERS
jgi:hypothetical protein